MCCRSLQSLRTECIKLQQRVWELEKQNRTLSLLLQSKLRASQSPNREHATLSDILVAQVNKQPWHCVTTDLVLHPFFKVTLNFCKF